MHNYNNYYPNPYYENQPYYNSNNIYDTYYGQYSGIVNEYGYNPGYMPTQHPNIIKPIDYGPRPFVVNIEEVTEQNDAFRTALWTGKHLQVTLMSLDVGEDIGLEVHSNLDQFICIEQGLGLVQMGDRKDMLDFQAYVRDDFVIIVPAGKWHNLTNIGNIPVKLYSIYAPPEHPRGTVHQTKADAEKAEHH